MSKDESKSAGLLSKVVRFVRHPTINWSELDRVNEEQDNDLSKQALKELMERKRRNDFVRKREFAQLRKMQQTVPAVNGQVIAPPPPEAINSSLSGAEMDGSAQPLSHAPLERKSTLQKIDEIEAQMSNQWWPGQPGQPGAATSIPNPAALATAATPAVITSPIPLTSAAPSIRAPLRNVPVLSEVVDSVPSVAASTHSIAPASVMSGPPSIAPPDSRLAQPAMAQAKPEPVPEEVYTPFVHDVELEDAAMLFAQGDTRGAEASLMALVQQRDAPRQLPVWLTLMDLYRATGQLPAFEKVAIDFAGRYGRSAPQWFAMHGVEQADGQSAPAVAVRAFGNRAGFRWPAPAHIAVQTVTALQASKRRSAGPWTLEWAHMVSMDESAAEPLMKLFEQWANESGTLVMLHSEKMQAFLESQTVTDNRDVSTNWWRLRMALLRLMNQPDDFEMAALDYCVTYEVSPPSWEDPNCTILREAWSQSADGADDDSAAKDVAAEQGRGELQGVIEGDAMSFLLPVQQKLHAGESVVIDCSQLVRMDFGAAGSVLNWSAEMQGAGHAVRFVKLQQLVAVFFNIVGVGEHSLIVPRKD